MSHQTQRDRGGKDERERGRIRAWPLTPQALPGSLMAEAASNPIGMQGSFVFDLELLATGQPPPRLPPCTR